MNTHWTVCGIAPNTLCAAIIVSKE